jgi:hypothetical protein
VPALFAIAVQILILLELLLEFGLDDVHRSIEVNRTLFNDDGLVRQMQRDFAAAPVVAFLFRLFEVDFKMGAVAVLAGDITVKTADFLVDMGAQALVYHHMDTLHFVSFQHGASSRFNYVLLYAWLPARTSQERDKDSAETCSEVRYINSTVSRRTLT